MASSALRRLSVNQMNLKLIRHCWTDPNPKCICRCRAEVRTQKLRALAARSNTPSEYSQLRSHAVTRCVGTLDPDQVCRFMRISRSTAWDAHNLVEADTDVDLRRVLLIWHSLINRPRSRCVRSDRTLGAKCSKPLGPVAATRQINPNANSRSTKRTASDVFVTSTLIGNSAQLVTGRTVASSILGDIEFESLAGFVRDGFGVHHSHPAIAAQTDCRDKQPDFAAGLAEKRHASSLTDSAAGGQTRSADRWFNGSLHFAEAKEPEHSRIGKHDDVPAFVEVVLPCEGDTCGVRCVSRAGATWRRGRTGRRGKTPPRKSHRGLFAGEFRDFAAAIEDQARLRVAEAGGCGLPLERPIGAGLGDQCAALSGRRCDGPARRPVL